MQRVLAVVMVTALVCGCARSEVGGSVQYIDEGGRVSEAYKAECLGQCLEVSADGKCVSFARGISEVCLNYLSNAKLLKPVQGDGSIFVSGTKAGGDINLKTD